MTPLTTLACILIAILLYVQLTYPTRYRPDFEIIQTDVSRLKPTMILEKYPIVIDDRIVDPKALLATTFKYQYNWIKEPTTLIGCPRAKYTLFYNNTAATANIDIVHPQYKHIATPPLTRIMLHSYQTLILPPLWSYKMTVSIKCIELWDVSHWIRANIF